MSSIEQGISNDALGGQVVEVGTRSIGKTSLFGVQDSIFGILLYFALIIKLMV